MCCAKQVAPEGTMCAQAASWRACKAPLQPETGQAPIDLLGIDNIRQSFSGGLHLRAERRTMLWMGSADASNAQVLTRAAFIMPANVLTWMGRE